MVKKAYLKSTGRMFRKHILRLLSIAAIFVITVSLDSGLGDVQNDIKKSINTSYIQDNIHDFSIGAINGDGTIIPKDLDTIKNELEKHKDYYEIDKIERVYQYDMSEPNKENFAYRVEFRDFIHGTTSIDKLEVLEGRLPQNNNEIVVERSTKDFNKHNIGDHIDVVVDPDYVTNIGTTFKNCEIVGIVKNPRYVTLKNEPSILPSTGSKQILKNLDDAFYFDIKALEDGWLKYISYISVTLNNRNVFNSYSKAYNEQINRVRTKIEAFIELETEVPEGTLVVALNYKLINYSFYSLNMYAEKVGSIAAIFIVFFALIAVLVIYSTMSRLLDEERSSMATLKTMGYSNLSIGIRYLSFAFIAGLLGIAVSIFPAHLVTKIILNAFTIQYAMKSVSLPLIGSFFFILASLVLFPSLIFIMIKSVKMARQNPVELLTHKTPKIGKKIFLEKFKRFWGSLSFKFKSTWRNVFLFKSRFVMTVLSIIASTVLIFASFALFACTISNLSLGIEALFTISLVLMLFSGALCALVIYNITNINISERTREIATLMVLGYREKEVTGYIYREIYILTLIGAIIGLPAGVGFISFVFKFIDVTFLNFQYVSWWVYILSPIVTCIFAFLATILLRHKIINIDMNESLKVLE